MVYGEERQSNSIKNMEDLGAEHRRIKLKVLHKNKQIIQMNTYLFPQGRFLWGVLLLFVRLPTKKFDFDQVRIYPVRILFDTVQDLLPSDISCRFYSTFLVYSK